MWRRAGWTVLFVSGCSEVLGFGAPVQVDPEAAARADASARDGGASLCDRAPAPTFCTRFDALEWTSEWTRTGAHRGWMERTTDDPFSAPASLRARVDGASPAWAAANVDFPAFAQLPREVEVTFRVRVDAANADDRVAVLSELFTVARVDGSPLLILQLTARLRTPGRLSLSILEVDLPGGTSSDHPLARDLPLGGWAELGFRLSRASSSSAQDTMTAHVDGAIAFSGPLALGIPEGMPRFAIGVVHSDSAAPSWDARYDDVLVDYR